MKRLLVYTGATEGYDQAIEVQARRIAANIASAGKRLENVEVTVLYVTDTKVPRSIRNAAHYLKNCKQINDVVVLNEAFLPHEENYKVNAQLLIAQMRTAAICYAIQTEADSCWSLDSDVLPPTNGLKCMIDMLAFDDGYYGAAFCPYPSQGGGSFLGGRGSTSNQIFPDVYEDEKTIPEELTTKRDELNAELTAEDTPHKRKKDIRDELNDLEKQIRAIPSEGNVFHNNAKGWRRRGWFDAAYPAVGKGAVVPTDWTGMGCVLMGRDALHSCDWVGYEGKGTEDLFVNYHRWKANGIQICVIPHCPCDHVIRHPSNKGEMVHLLTYHEAEGECEGHLRQKAVPWYTHNAGERQREANDGDMSPSVKEEPESPKVPNGKKP